MRQVSLMMARFPYQNQECPDSVDWFMQTMLKVKQDPRISEVFTTRPDDTPITMTRNQAVERAKKQGCDYLLMLDSDMAPDLPGEQPFWDTAFDFAYQHPGPCLIGAPYCGPPPFSNVYVFRWAQPVNPHADRRMTLEMFPREEAAGKRQIEEVAALPTGLILIDLRAIDRFVPPYFYYEWKDPTQSEKASTEDVTFTRDISLSGTPIYCAWGSWAGHWKRWLATRPAPLNRSTVGRQLREAFHREAPGIQHAPRGQERLVQIRRQGLPPPPNGYQEQPIRSTVAIPRREEAGTDD